MSYPASMSAAAMALDTGSSSTWSVTSASGRNILPPRLQETMAKGLLAEPRPGLYILGTAHIGSESAEEAQALIEFIRPSTVVVEIPPSRLKRIRFQNSRKKEEQNKITQPDESDATTVKLKKSGTMMSAIGSLPALAAAGWSQGGLSGLLFSTAIVGSSLLKRSTTASEEEVSLPRRNEFTAAIEVADSLNGASCNIEIIPADLEFEDLVAAVSRSLTPIDWCKMGLNLFLSETVGILPADPIRRAKGEDMVQWANRRRDIATSRASKLHGEETAPEMSKVLVDERDAKFAEICLKVLSNNARDAEVNDDGQVANTATVCIVGLVHLDGVVERLQL